MMRYWPVPSVTAERTFSMSAGLEASTVTPGSTAPEASRTVPVREAWANTVPGRSRTTTIVRHFSAVCISAVFFLEGVDTFPHTRQDPLRAVGDKAYAAVKGNVNECRGLRPVLV